MAAELLKGAPAHHTGEWIYNTVATPKPPPKAKRLSLEYAP